MAKEFTFVTGNAKKLEEFLLILSGGDTSSFKVGEYTVKNKKLDLDEIQGTIQEVTKHKAQQAAEILNGPALVEDTCLGFTALNNLPGPYIKWFVNAIGLEGLVKMLHGFEDKSAHSICTYGFCEGPGKPVLLFQGVTKGNIVDSRGPKDFGFDSIFEPEGYSETFAEMRKTTKNSISHRYRALAKLRKFLIEGVYDESEPLL